MTRALKGNAVITGGARGIGLAIARRMLQDGYSVSLWDINPEVLNTAQILRSEGQAANATVVDVTDENAVRGAIGVIQQHRSEVAALVNNAGLNGPVKPTIEYTLLEWRQVIDINLVSAFICSKALIPMLRSQPSSRIINIASIAGKEGNANISAYSAAKAGLIGFTKALAKELVAEGIFVHAIAPAMTETPMMEEMTAEYIQSIRAKIPMGRLCRPGEVAAAVSWLCSEEYSFSTGAVLDLSGGRATY